MKIRLLILNLVILVASEMAVAQQNTAQSAPIAEVNRLDLFKRTLAYLPSMMLAAMPRMKVSQIEASLFKRVMEISSQNILLDDPNEFIFPRKYVNVGVIGSRDTGQFILTPGEHPRSAFTTPEPRSPIYINENLINNPQTEITLPGVVQILVHELGQKATGQRLHPQLQMAMDRLAAEIGRVLSQDYMVFSISPTEKIHILNAPYIHDLPNIGMNPFREGHEEQLNLFKTHAIRRGREILIFHENKNGFTYVPSLKPGLLKDLHSMKQAGENQALPVANINIEEIRIDRGDIKRPLLRFRMNIRERAYRLTQKDKSRRNDSTDDIAIQSMSALNSDNIQATNGDEILEKKIEVAIRFLKDGNVDISRREVLAKEPRLNITDLKWNGSLEGIKGSLKIQVPDSMKDIIDLDLRAFMMARLEDGLARIEITRLEPKKNTLEIEFKLPSNQMTSQSFFVEEILLKNKTTEMLIDLPEAIVVKKSGAAKNKMKLFKFERLNQDTWSPLKFAELEKERTDPRDDIPLHKSAEIPGLIHVKPGQQKFRMLFRSDAPLHEIYFYMRASYVSHDPLIKHTIQSAIKGFGFIGEALMKSNSQLQFQSVSYVQMIDEVVHIPASEMRQTQKGPYLWVEFSIPMNVMSDKGPNSYDGGIRYIGKAIAVNQKMERWRVLNFRDPIFAVEGTSFGAESCRTKLGGQ